MNTDSFDYLNFLRYNVYNDYCSVDNKISCYPNLNLPKHFGKMVVHYKLETRCLSLFKQFHDLWYV